MKTCGGKKRSGGLCKNTAGKGTDHLGEGRCFLHGGRSGRPIIHGRYSVKHRERLAASLGNFLGDPRPRSLVDEIALSRALLQDFLDRITKEKDADISIENTKHVFEMTDSIGKNVERMSRIINHAALTQADIIYLQATLSDLLIRYIEDPEKRLSFMAELRQAMGSSVSTDPRIAQSE